MHARWHRVDYSRDRLSRLDTRLATQSRLEPSRRRVATSTAVKSCRSGLGSQGNCPHYWPQAQQFSTCLGGTHARAFLPSSRPWPGAEVGSPECLNEIHVDYTRPVPRLLLWPKLAAVQVAVHMARQLRLPTVTHASATRDCAGHEGWLLPGLCKSTRGGACACCLGLRPGAAGSSAVPSAGPCA